MRTVHRIRRGDSANLEGITTESVGLVVTSPPYPMIEMWDETFATQNPAIRQSLEQKEGWAAFDLMHEVLDRVWKEVYRVLADGGFACINIGDATRTIGGKFALYPNHSRVQSSLLEIGFTPLPAVLWRKPTNSPTKFMGSGMLPAGAYVTLEHEYVLIFRKGAKREFTRSAEKRNRRESALFWEERNKWFSDVWTGLPGTKQTIDNGTRKRSGAFPFELPYRLINMYSVKGDTVLDPFLGTGTTMLAAVAAGRNSVGYEIDPGFRTVVADQWSGVLDSANTRIRERLTAHAEFVRNSNGGPSAFNHTNSHYGFPVKSQGERDLILNELVSTDRLDETTYTAEYSEEPQEEYVRDWAAFVSNDHSVNGLGAEISPKAGVES